MNVTDQIGHTPTVVLMALVRVEARDRRATVRAVAAEAELSVHATHGALRLLDAEGLVVFPPRVAGALRSRVWPVRVASVTP